MKRWQIWMRNAARAVGVPKLLLWREQREFARHRQEYRAARPTTVRIGEGAWSADFLVGDEDEFVNLRQKVHDREILRVLAGALPAGSSCWDIGANIGIYSVIAARCVGPNGRVIAFEPEPRSRQRLLENVKANGLNNVQAMPVAVGASEGSFHMVVGASASSGTHRLVQNAPTSNGARADADEKVIDVRVVNGDAYRAEADLPVPTLIKVDVEGAELDVFSGLRQTMRDPACRAVICEVHFAILNSRGLPDAPVKIESLLKECGFTRQHWIDRSHLAAYKS